MTPDTMSRRTAEGERRRDAAHALLQAEREVYVRRGRRALLEAVLRNGTATADDVRTVVKLPHGLDPKCFGAVPTPLVKAGIIRRAGFVQTSRAAGHARPVTRWELTDPNAARRWLAEHPDRPDPMPTDANGQTLFDLPRNATPGVGAPGGC